MKYPKPLKPGSCIAVTAFSSGILEQHEPRLNLVVRHLEQQGYRVILGECLKGNSKHVSASKELRVAELMHFLTDDRVDAVAPPWGGELAIELLPLLDFDLLALATPKWVFGFSDVSTLTTVLTYRLGWATAHCANLMDLIGANSDPLTARTLPILSTTSDGNLKQIQSEKYTRQWPDLVKDPSAGIVGNSPTQWQWLVAPKGESLMSGRLIGGCWDTLIHLFDTPYLCLKGFQERHEEGVLLYLENVEMSPCDLVRAIHNMSFRGVFNSINGLILGRNFRLDSESIDDLTYLEVMIEHLSDKGIPVIYNVDVGHVPPNLTLINGCYAEIELLDGVGSITQWFK